MLKVQFTAEKAFIYAVKKDVYNDMMKMGTRMTPVPIEHENMPSIEHEGMSLERYMF